MLFRLVLLCGLLGPIVCHAHAILMASIPALGGHAGTGVLAITLRYNSLIDVKRSRVMLIEPGGGVQQLAIGGGGAGDEIHATVVVRPGANLLRWQVLAVDGHITRGNVDFDVTGAAPAAGH